MKDIEDAAEPVMAALIRGKRSRLFEREQTIIATWAVLKVMVVHHKNIQPAKRRQLMREGKPPPGWNVWIANYKRKRWKVEWLSRPFPVHAKPRRSTRFATPNNHSTTQIIKNLFIHVVNCPMDDFAERWKFTAPSGDPLGADLLRIWPLTGRSILWPPKPLSDRDAEYAADAVARNVARVIAAMKRATVSH